MLVGEKAELSKIIVLLAEALELGKIRNPYL